MDEVRIADADGSAFGRNARTRRGANVDVIAPIGEIKSRLIADDGVKTACCRSQMVEERRITNGNIARAADTGTQRAKADRLVVQTIAISTECSDADGVV